MILCQIRKPNRNKHFMHNAGYENNSFNESIFSLEKKIPKSYVQRLILIFVIPFKA